MTQKETFKNLSCSIIQVISNLYDITDIIKFFTDFPEIFATKLADTLNEERHSDDTTINSVDLIILGNQVLDELIENEDVHPGYINDYRSYWVRTILAAVTTPEMATEIKYNYKSVLKAHGFEGEIK